MTTTPQTEASRLANWLDGFHKASVHHECAAELRRLDALVAHLTVERDNLASELATRTEANRTLVTERDQLRSQLDQAVQQYKEDAERYRCIRRGQHVSVINGIGDILRAENLDAAIDAAMAKGVK